MMMLSPTGAREGGRESGGARQVATDVEPPLKQAARRAQERRVAEEEGMGWEPEEEGRVCHVLLR